MGRTPETFLYLREDLHTGQLRYAASELVKHSLGIVDFYLDEVRKIEPIPENCLPPLIIRGALSPGHLNGKLRSDWQRTETRLLELLKDTGIVNDPKETDNKIELWLRRVPFFENTREAAAHLRLTQERLSNLLSGKVQEKLDSLKQAGVSYIESRVLKLAIFNGIYLARPYYN